MISIWKIHGKYLHLPSFEAFIRKILSHSSKISSNKSNLHFEWYINLQNHAQLCITIFSTSQIIVLQDQYKLIEMSVGNVYCSKTILRH